MGKDRKICVDEVNCNQNNGNAKQNPLVFLREKNQLPEHQNHRKPLNRLVVIQPIARLGDSPMASWWCSTRTLPPREFTHLIYGFSFRSLPYKGIINDDMA